MSLNGAGRPHSHREIAEAARLLAEAVLAQSKRRVLGSLVIGGLIDALLVGGGGWIGMSIAERRAARRILEARQETAASL